MPTLSQPTLSITLLSGTSQVKITGRVKVSFDQVEKNFIKLLGVKFKVGCRIWGEDSDFNGGDNPLFSIKSKTITAGGTQTFTRTVDTSSLDEDYGNDEIYARFGCKSTTPSFPLRAIPQRSDTIVGNF